MRVKYLKQNLIESGHSRKVHMIRRDNVKLEMDLLRDLLLYVEENASRPYNDLEDISLEGWTEDQVTYHVVLAEEDGLLTATIDELPDNDDPVIVHVTYSIHRLTSKGHELLGTIREPAAWGAVKSGVNKVGAVTVSVVTAVAQAYLKQKITEYSGIQLS